MTILTHLKDSAAIITLNRPGKYNAVDLATILQISAFLNEIRDNPLVKKIILTSDHPKAFCAGGDISAAYEAMQNQDFEYGIDFFELEYRLIRQLATYTKPIISLVNGLCLGGGMGLSMHNRLRIVTQNAVLGMPETIIGFFPDVGASYRFAQFPKAWANFYGLTGYNIALKHALNWNMADYFVHSDQLPSLLDALCLDDVHNDHQVIEQFTSVLPDETIFGEPWVEEVFTLPLPDILRTLQNYPAAEAQKTFQDLQMRSPLSLRVTAKLLEMVHFLSLEKSLVLDLILAKNFMHVPSFKEGIRAQVIDKDRNPKWQYSMSEISDEMLRDFFVPTYADDESAV